MTAVPTATRLSYPIPDEYSTLADFEPRTLLPLETPPPITFFPPLPSPPRKSLLDDTYTLTTHLIPAAYPRTTPYLPEANPPRFSADKKEFQQSVKETLFEVLGTKQKQWDGELPDEGRHRQLWACANRYVRKEKKATKNEYPYTHRPLTLFFAHANGFPKEIWEPTIREILVQNARLPKPLDIYEIWVWEAVNHGDAALVNAEKLGGIYDWCDNTRDMLHFLLNYIPTDPRASTLPTHLQRVPADVAESRRWFGHGGRDLAVVGHSFGGCTSALAALNVPALFSSLVLVDPIVRPLFPGAPLLVWEIHTKMCTDAIRRKARWESREEALKQFKASPFFGIWHPDALKLYVDCGLFDDPSGGVRLKMSGIQEAVNFAESLTCSEVWKLLPQLSPQIPLKWVMPENEPSAKHHREKAMIQELVWLRPANSSNVIIPATGHLIPHESPRQLASELLEFWKPKYTPRDSARL